MNRTQKRSSIFDFLLEYPAADHADRTPVCLVFPRQAMPLAEALIFQPLGNSQLAGGPFWRPSRLVLRRATPNVDPDLEFRMAN